MHTKMGGAPASAKLSRTPVVVLMAQDLRWIISAFVNYFRGTSLRRRT